MPDDPMLDTDQDWNASVERQARSKRIQVLASNPCFEAVMLRLLGKNPVGDGKALKKQLAPFVNNEPTLAQNYGDNFGSECLEEGRGLETTIDVLLKLMGH